jgi:mannose-6-phosphate isomerase-like protein (cupin superfamily)
MKVCALLMLMLAWTAKSQAQASGTVVQISGSSIDSAFRDLMRNPAEVARELPAGASDRYQVVVLKKQATTPAEIHERWTDIVFVRTGNAVLQTGETLVGKKRSDASEWTGSAIKNPEERRVSAGDIVLIAAGVAHQWRIIRREGFSYIVVKVRPGGGRPNTR